MTFFRVFPSCKCWVITLTLFFIFIPIAFAQNSVVLFQEKLPDDLKGIDIQDRYVPAGSFPKAGVVHALQGIIIVVHRSDNQAFTAKKGDPIHENDEIITLADSRCRIRLLSDDVVNMAPDTRFAVDQFKDSPEKGRKTSIFTMLKGKAVFYALRLFRYRDTRFRVKTPTAVVGVRGTKFGVHVFSIEEEQADVRGVLVADRSAGLSPYLAKAESNDLMTSGTIVACADGQLDVTDPQTGNPIAEVNPNEDFNSTTGQKTFDPQNTALNKMISESEVQDGDGDQGTTGKDTTGSDTQGDSYQITALISGEDTAATDATDFSDLTTDITNQQTGDETATAPESNDDGYPQHHYGYFNGILTASLGTGGYYATEVLTNLDGSGTVQGHREGVNVGSMDYSGSGAPGIKNITALTHNGNTVDSGLPATVDYWEYGHNSFMVWGGWRQPIAMIHTPSGIEHYFDYRGYYFAGDYTTDAQMAALHGSLGVVTYSGEAWGKHYMQPSGTDMMGTFTAQVNFSSPAVTDLDMYVSGGGHSASITDAQGSFTGSSSQFVINPSSGSWHVDGVSPMFNHAEGGLYGNEAQKMGFIWSMKESAGSSNLAWGMGVGGR